MTRSDPLEQASSPSRRQRLSPLKQVSILAVLAVCLASLMSTVPAQSAEAGTKRGKCIYMVHKSGSEGGAFGYLIWHKKGREIKGVDGGHPGEWTDQRLRYKRAKNRAVGWYRNWLYGYEEGPEWYPVTYKTKGKGGTLRAKGYKRVTRATMEKLLSGPVNTKPGSRCY